LDNESGNVTDVKKGRLDMNALISFFTLRPIFTFSGLQLVWYIFLLNVVVQLYASVSNVIQLLAQRGISWESWSPNFLPLILSMTAQLLVVRLLLEVAAVVLLSSRAVRQQGAEF